VVEPKEVGVMDRMRMLSEGEGVVWVDITDQLEVNDINAHWHALRRFLRTGDRSGLEMLDGAGVGLHRFETDADEIAFWAFVALRD
jgi:hypothetical protein